MIAIQNSIIYKALAKHKSEIDLIIVDAKSRLRTLKKNLYGDEKDYVIHLYKNIKLIVAEADSEKLFTLKQDFDKIIPSKTMASKYKKPFRDKVLKALGYITLRSKFYPKYFRALELKACVYCNSSLTVSIKSTQKRKFIAKFQVDHFIPKSDYPCFSISFFNLYPCCGPCNNVKLTNEVEFNLFSGIAQKTAISEFKFSLDRAGVARYILTKHPEDITISFSEPPVKNKKSKSFQEVFDIEGIYDTQKDVAEELIIKARIYNAPYKQKLIDSFPKLFNNANLANRVLIGNYAEPTEIHKRPMAKFTQDVAKQLGLI